MKDLLLAALLVFVVAEMSDAQVVRGTVTDRQSGLPIPGVVVTLERLPTTGNAPSRAVGNALTNAQGQYAIRTTAPGAYVVSAKRIGVQRFTSAPFELGEGETRELNISLEPVSHSLDAITVVAREICTSRPDEGQRVAALWDDIQAALTATQISVREQRFRASVYRYVRELELRTHRVVKETRSETHGRVDRPFRSISTESLSAAGYWRESESTTTYHVPDPDVLLSPEFLRDHCFQVSDGRNTPSGMIGLAFEPSGDRNVPDVRGTLWVDSATSELRQLTFEYDRLPDWARSASAGGDVRFSRLPSGAWFVRRWFVQMPQFAIYRTFDDARLGRPATQRDRRGLYRVIEEGGSAFVDGASLVERPASVEGTVVDTLGTPVAGAAVRLGGSPFQMATDPGGAYRFDSLPSGSYTIVVEHPAYEAFGMPAADSAFRLEEGATERINLRMASSVAVVRRLCDNRRANRDQATLRLRVRERATGEPLRSAPVHLFWLEAVGGDTPWGTQTMTDSEGWASFCDVPPQRNLYVRLFLPNGEPGPLAARCLLGKREVAAKVVVATRPTIPPVRPFPDTLSRLPECRPVGTAAAYVAAPAPSAAVTAARDSTLAKRAGDEVSGEVPREIVRGAVRDSTGGSGDSDALAARMCGGRAPAAGRLAMRLTVVDSLAGAPVRGQNVRIAWLEYEQTTAGGMAVRRAQPVEVAATTDEAGAVTVCEVPVGVALELSSLVGQGDARPIATVQVPDRRVWSVVVSTVRR